METSYDYIEKYGTSKDQRLILSIIHMLQTNEGCKRQILKHLLCLF